MFERLARTTEVEDGVPATRAVVWPIAWRNIKERPFLGHGPRLLQQHELRFRRVPDEQLVGPYPHNLYLHLLVSVGLVGTFAMLFFFVSIFRHLYLGVKHGVFESDYDRGMVVMGVLVLGTFLIDELKIEFNRDATEDYMQFMFALFGIFVGWADKARSKSRYVSGAQLSYGNIANKIDASSTKVSSRP
jgi:O-antigen ligase